jgi:uncharacterized membrane protein
MATLVVLAFKDETGAARMRDRLAGLQKRQFLSLADDAVVVRRRDGKIRVKQAVSLVGAGALGGAFWGMLIGRLFAAPWSGETTGWGRAAPGDCGVDEKFVQEVATKIKPGHSALFLMVENSPGGKVMDEFARFNAEVLLTSLSKEDEAKLQAAFGAEE